MCNHQFGAHLIPTTTRFIRPPLSIEHSTPAPLQPCTRSLALAGRRLSPRSLMMIPLQSPFSAARRSFMPSRPRRGGSMEITASKQPEARSCSVTHTQLVDGGRERVTRSRSRLGQPGGWKRFRGSTKATLEPSAVRRFRVGAMRERRPLPGAPEISVRWGHPPKSSFRGSRDVSRARARATLAGVIAPISLRSCASSSLFEGPSSGVSLNICSA